MTPRLYASEYYAVFRFTAVMVYLSRALQERLWAVPNEGAAAELSLEREVVCAVFCIVNDNWMSCMHVSRWSITQTTPV